MNVVDPYAPGGEHNRQGLGTGKPPKKQYIKKPKTDESSEEESEYEDEERDQVREAWRKKPKAKKESSGEE